MDSRARKKRLCLDNCNQNDTLPCPVKKSRGEHNTTKMFMDVISGLSPEQVSVVNDIGFSSLLKLSCSEIPVDLYKWLAMNFDTSARALRTPNGFSFKFNNQVVKKMLGIPDGLKKVFGKGTLHSLTFIQSVVPSKNSTPSVSELCALINSEVKGSEFARLFMLLALSAFLCPNTRSVCSSRYYPAIINVAFIQEYDWCSFVLDWLVNYIRKYQESTIAGHTDSIGGCSFLLVVCYLEFLITAEYNLGVQCPRINVWSTPIVRALSYLDSFGGSDVHFGRLQLKGLLADLTTNLVNSINSSAISGISSSLQNVVNYIISEASYNLDRTSQTLLEDTDSDSDEPQKVILRATAVKRHQVPDDVYNLVCKYFPKFDVPSIDDTKSSWYINCTPGHILKDELVDLKELKRSDFDSEYIGNLKIEDIDIIFQRTLNRKDEKQEMKCDKPDIDLYSLALFSDVQSSSKPVIEERLDTTLLESLIHELEIRDHVSDQPKSVQKVAKPEPNPPKDVYIHGFEPFNIVHSVFGEDNDEDESTSEQFQLLDDLQKGFQKCAQMLNEEELTPRPSKHLIFASPIEIELYQLLTTTILRPTQSIRIYQNGQTWVDQFKLSLSMMNGGWIHFHVMDCFLKMLAWHQACFENQEGHIYQQYFEHSVSDILMTPKIQHSGYKKKFLECVGLKIDKGGLLHIPCYISKKWMLITVNFIHERFDILDSDFPTDESKAIVHTVISNFRTFFKITFPHCSLYNIDNFAVRFVNVPKHKYRYDSGIFLLNFVQTFNGLSVQPFSNSDIPALRTKFVFQLLTSKSNEARSELVNNFLQKHVSLSIENQSTVQLLWIK
ncbi:hypothetical protein EJB05_47298 [Eragrostis curvula]|uniref:Uncharacterized protein n=1 Tax=Eragrostis curvula TaxID=38414 RepID=A0A5J9T754_9POAL|nr:hypothetical protein EJB05_47298 [Eragrostis curvula]